jgi:hypothetical protein
MERRRRGRREKKAKGFFSLQAGVVEEEKK